MSLRTWFRLMATIATVVAGAAARPAQAAAPIKVTNINNAGPGSLRQAILDANTQAGADTIVFDLSAVQYPAPPYSILLQSGLPTITGDVVITGPGADKIWVEPLNSSLNFPIFSAFGAVNVEIQKLRIFRGRGSMGGGIMATGGTLTLTDCVVDASVVTGSGGGVYMRGSGDATINIVRTQVVSNTAADHGGGIYLFRDSGKGTINLTDATIGKNIVDTAAAARMGGGIYLGGPSGSHSLVGMRSTIYNNAVPGSGMGGGVHFEGGGTLSLTNCTVAGNTAGPGSALDLLGVATTIVNCTVTGNNTLGPANVGAGCIRAASGTALTIKNTILSGNVSGLLLRDLGDGMPVTGNNNLVGTGGSFSGGGNILGVNDPKLAPLAMVGGMTPVFHLRPDSPALDRAAAADAPATDQRGQARPADGDNDGVATADIGAFETQKYVVTTALDAGAGSLRQAVLDNNIAGGGFIRFNIGGAHQTSPGFTIPLATNLATIARPVFIDGWSQASGPYIGPPLIELDGNAIAAGGIGLDITGFDCIIRGLAINRFNGTGMAGLGVCMRSNTALRNWIYGCYVGLGLDGVTAKGNGDTGVFIDVTANNNLIGTNSDGINDAAERNVVSGQSRGGRMTGVCLRSNGNALTNCFAGVNAAGTGAVANGNYGVWVDAGATSNRLGSGGFTADPAAERNLISGNGVDGVRISGAASGTTVSGSLIGTDITGMSAIPNGVGVDIVDSATSTIGGGSAVLRNVISGNRLDGVRLGGAGAMLNSVSANYVGLKADGGSALANGGAGVSVRSGANINFIGPANGVVGTANVVSGNTGRGVELLDALTTDNVVTGNFVGTNAAGLLAVPNSGGGIGLVDATKTTIGGPGNMRNIVAGNTGTGVDLSGASAKFNIISGNSIGINLAQSALGNSGVGVALGSGAADNIIGGLDAGAGNTIANNTLEGVRLLGDTSIENAIVGNSITGNARLGIDLGADGVTANGAAGVVRVGPNRLTNYPEIVSVTSSGGVTAQLLGRASTLYHVEFFSSPLADPSGFGEGKTLLGSMDVHTSAAGSAGTILFSFPANQAEPFITATATQVSEGGATASAALPSGTPLSTSEFSKARALNIAPVSQNVAVTTAEDTDAVVGLSATDANSDPLAFRISSLPARGSLLQFGTLTPITSVPTTVTDGGGRVVFRPTADAFGASWAAFGFVANDGLADSNGATATVSVTPVADTPSITGASTVENTQTTSGLVISRNLADGAEVTHFKITAVSNGSLFLADGVTGVTVGQFIPVAQGAAGLRFTPAAGYSGSTTVSVRASIGTSDSGLGGGTAMGTIVVTPNAKTPTITNASTLEDTLSASGLVITRNAINGPEVTHFKVVSVTNGTLFLANGSTAVSVGQFITAAQGAAGLRFKPSPDYFGGASVQVAASSSASDVGISNGAATGSITVTPVNDAPSFTASNPTATFQSASPAVSIPGWAAFSAGPANESDQTVMSYTISNLTNSGLFQTPPAVALNGTLTYTPMAWTFGTATFAVRVRDSGGTANGGVDTSPPQTFTITVLQANQPPSFTASDPVAVLEGSGAKSAAFVTSFSPGPAAESGQHVLAYLVDQLSNPSLFAASPAVANDGNLTYTLASMGYGTSTFRVRVRDDGGTVNGGNDTSPGQMFTIVVRPAARSQDVTVDARTVCPSLKVPLSAINLTPSAPGPGATQSVTADRDLTREFAMGRERVTLNVVYSDGLRSSSASWVTVLGNDCNSNGIPDACEIAAGTATDCNGDGIPDTCQCVWDNGAGPTGADAALANGQLSHLGGAVPWGAKAADDFYLPPCGLYRVFGYTGVLINNSLPNLRKARLEFYEDCNGKPSGTPIATYTSSKVTSTIPVGNGYDLVSYSFEFCSTPLYLEGGRSYWVSLFGLTDGQGTDVSYWVSVTPNASPLTTMGSPPAKTIGTPGMGWPYFQFEPWAPLDDCCLGCVNMVFSLRGEVCPLVWDNGDPATDAGAIGGTPSGINVASFPAPKAADNFVLKPCETTQLCVIEACVYTNCLPVAGYIDLYGDDCGKPIGDPIFHANTTRAVSLGYSYVLDGKTYPAYKLIFENVNWILGGGKTFWLSAGADGKNAINGRSFFCWNGACRPCPIRITPGSEMNQPGAPIANVWTSGTHDFSFRIFGRPVQVYPSGGGPGGPPVTCAADVNRDGKLSVQDLFDFLTAYFTGCQ